MTTTEIPSVPVLQTTDPRLLLKSLQNDFPVFRDSKPLVIGIDKQLLARLPELDRKTLRIALGIHTHSTRYLKAVANGITRFDLQGNAGDALTESHRKHALDTLQERAAKEAERRKEQEEQRKREAAERRRETAEIERSQKLGQLVAKFGRGN